MQSVPEGWGRRCGKGRPSMFQPSRGAGEPGSAGRAACARAVRGGRLLHTLSRSFVSAVINCDFGGTRAPRHCPQSARGSPLCRLTYPKADARFQMARRPAASDRATVWVSGRRQSHRGRAFAHGPLMVSREPPLKTRSRTCSAPGRLRGGREQSAACGPGRGPLTAHGWAQRCGARVQTDAGRRRDSNPFSRVNRPEGEKDSLYFAPILCLRVFVLRAHVLLASCCTQWRCASPAARLLMCKQNAFNLTQCITSIIIPPLTLI